MLQYAIRRLLVFIPTMFVLSILIFGAVELGPGDAASYMIPPDMPLDQVEQLREAMGLNQPVTVRYFTWIKQIVSGNWGRSMLDGASVKDLLILRIPRTMQLMALSMLLAIIIGIGLGVASAMRQNSFADHILTFFGLIGISTPTFFIGLFS